MAHSCLGLKVYRSKWLLLALHSSYFSQNWEWRGEGLTNMGLIWFQYNVSTNHFTLVILIATWAFSLLWSPNSVVVVIAKKILIKCFDLPYKTKTPMAQFSSGGFFFCFCFFVTTVSPRWVLSITNLRVKREKVNLLDGWKPMNHFREGEGQILP